MLSAVIGALSLTLPVQQFYYYLYGRSIILTTMLLLLRFDNCFDFF